MLAQMDKSDRSITQDPQITTPSSLWDEISREQSIHEQKILILAAIPRGLRLDTEIREIEEAIKRADKRDLFEIRTRTDVRPQDIRRAIAEERPQIVHFCGHGMEDGSLLLGDDEGGNDILLSPQVLASLFELHDDYVKCVLLNACYSAKCAEAISQYINYAIGMNQPIQDQAAIAFTQGFYDGLGYSNPNNEDPIQRAFKEGMIAIRMKNLSQNSMPVLKKRLEKSPLITPSPPPTDILRENEIREEAISTSHPEQDTVNNEIVARIEKSKKTKSNSIDPVRQLAGCIRPKSRYVNIEKIAEGSIAILYKAYDTILERDVAIKVLNHENLTQEFEKSIKEAAKISDEPHFITIYDYVVNKDKDVHYYIMQFIEGQNLRQRMDDLGQGLPVELVHKIIINVGKALIRVRELGFKDGGNIRPSNIMLNECNEPVISAFNLCKSFSPKKMKEELERMSKELGNQEYAEELAYLLPEQFRRFNSQTLSVDKSDQYMLGLLAYELLTSEIPPVLKSFEDLKQYKDKAFKELKSITEKRPECPKIFENVIIKMASLCPEDRYETLQDALDALPKNANVNLNIAKESYARCMKQPNFHKEFFKYFYHKFTVELCPHAAQKFSSFETEEDWKHQHQMLKEAILLLFTYFELNGHEQNDHFLKYDEQDNPNILSWIAKTHKRRNIPEKFYQPFVDALIEKVTKFDPLCQEHSEYEDLVKQALEEVIAPGVKYMISKS